LPMVLPFGISIKHSESVDVIAHLNTGFFRPPEKDNAMKASLTMIVLFALGAVFLDAQTPEGIDVVDVVKVSATVQKVDLEKRKATLLLSDGKSKTVKVDKSVRNLDQVQPGDHLNIIYTEETVIVIGKTGEQVGASGGGVVSVAAKGAKPGAYSVETESMTGKILAVDVPKHKVTIEDPDGKKKTVKVSKKIQNLDQLKVGDNIDIGVTEALAIQISK